VIMENEPTGRCPNCGEDELEGPGGKCLYCGWHDYDCEVCDDCIARAQVPPNPTPID
jgi:hypothetical protein